jgi:hypothetical protein
MILVYSVEFFDIGNTVAVVALPASAVRLPHQRNVQPFVAWRLTIPTVGLNFPAAPDSGRSRMDLQEVRI